MDNPFYFSKLLTKHGITEIDYKDTALVEKFISPHFKIRPSKKTGATAKQQREISQAIKRARFMALVPFTRV
jgi:small subunit ribosomal protein S18